MKKLKTKRLTNGYIHKMQAYNDAPRSDYVMVLNQSIDIFKDKNVRLAFHHAMNVDKVINQVLRGDYNRLQGISRGYGKYTNESIKARPFDIKKGWMSFWIRPAGRLKKRRWHSHQKWQDAISDD
jgi:microcin C transport system substrate-binding protein